MNTSKTYILVGGAKEFTNQELVDKELPNILNKHGLKADQIEIYGYEDSSKKAGAYDVAERWAAKNNVPFMDGSTKSGEDFSSLLAERNNFMATTVKLFVNLRKGNANGGKQIVEAVQSKGVPVEIIDEKSNIVETAPVPKDVTDIAESPEPSPKTKRKGTVPSIEAVARSVAIYSKVAQKLLNSACVMLDTETTGLNDDDEVIELAILDCSTGATLFDSLIKTDKKSNPQAFKVNNITPEMLKGKSTIGEVWSTVEGMVGNRVVLASNCAFDERLINQSLRKHDLTCSFFWYDIQTLYRNYSCQNSASQYPLKTIGMCQQLGLEAGTHRAKSDVEAQIRLLKGMAKGIVPNFDI
jgi:DNA polymerase-3 subunit epsilon